MKFYIGARYGRKDEALELAIQLERLGHEITSTWIRQEEDEMGYTAEEGTTQQMAIKDVEEIGDAEAFIALSELESNPWGRGGRHVEFGVAVAGHKELIVIGPLENIFHYLPDITQYTNVEEFLVEMGRE